MYRKICLGLMVFTCGWVLMALEMIGPRIMAPDFGSGIYVWGSIISTFLLALSIGYWVGGQVSKKWNTPLSLTIIGLAVAGWTFLIIWTHKPVNGWLFDVGVVEVGLHERWPALASAFAFFFLPSILLGMVSPIAIRLAASKLETVGASAGSLYAVSTMGSFLGCIVTAFHFIDKFAIPNILIGHAVVLACASVLFFLALSRGEQ